MGDLTKNFSRKELECSCGKCETFNVDEEFLYRLQLARTSAGIPFNITSGCRCGMHNKTVGGKPTSDHLASDSVKCCAADIACYGSHARYIIIKASLLSGLNRIGIGKNFLHLGQNKENIGDVIWLYP